MSESIEEATARVKALLANRTENPAAKFLHRQNKLRAELLEKYGPDYQKERYSFQVNKAEYEVINEWLKELKPEIIALQRKQGMTDPLNAQEPYYGSTGGGITYMFQPTSIGDILIVKETTTGKELNVTAALEWIFFG